MKLCRSAGTGHIRKRCENYADQHSHCKTGHHRGLSRDCFIISLSERRRAAVAAACQARGVDLYECKTTVENEKDMLKAVDEVKARRLQRPGGVPGQLWPRDPRDPHRPEV